MRRGAEAVDRTAPDRLRGILSFQYIVLTKMRNFRVEFDRPGFEGQRDLMDAQCWELRRLIEQVDVALRARGIGPLAALKDFLEHARLKDNPSALPDVPVMLADLIADHEALTQRAADGRGDRVFEDVARGHERMAWMLRKILETRGPLERRR